MRAKLVILFETGQKSLSEGVFQVIACLFLKTLPETKSRAAKGNIFITGQRSAEVARQGRLTGSPQSPFNFGSQLISDRYIV
jgi:hypothetical protein